jgi:hypothetical protein
MIIAKTDAGMLIIGLSRRNVELLVAGQPIVKDAFGPMPAIAIVYGETEQAIFEGLTADDVAMPYVDVPKGEA